MDLDFRPAKYVWDYDLSQEQFDRLLAGEYADGVLDRDWAAVRLIEYAPYEDMIRRIGYARLVELWPQWRGRLRSEQQRNSLDFVVDWLLKYHPELLVKEHSHVA